MLRNAMLLASLYAGRSWPGVGSVEVVIGLLDVDVYDWAELRRACRRIGPQVSVRPFRWRRLETGSARVVFPAAPLSDAASVVVPVDGARAFRDADAWIVMASHTSGAVAWLRPSAVFCADLLPRRVPAAFGGPQGLGDRAALAETMVGWRDAACVFATTPMTLSDVVSYAGVPPERAVLVPLQTEADALANMPAATGGPSEPGLLWVTNAAPHKNHVQAVAALRAYLTAGGGLDVTVCGVDGHLLDPRSGSRHAGALAFAAAPEVLARTAFLNEPGDAEFHRLMAARGVVWHNAVADNGSFVAFDAARAGAHLVSSDYPPMRYLCEQHGIATLFHPPADPDVAAQALLEAERRVRARVPPAHKLREPTAAELEAGYGDVLRRLVAAARSRA
ncbi:glycosyltransferase family protein [Falsiroseomonas oryziterrae]|uniref:hypothetical protein n=1 Tax=Falsiroseomonas oryziterrae TaxID=2911368 RepID=UPI001F185584|nr:hypothetical protein [Roseomonas sp. NPKOSM-4]